MVEQLYKNLIEELIQSLDSDGQEIAKKLLFLAAKCPEYTLKTLEEMKNDE